MGLDMYLKAEHYLSGMWQHMAEDQDGKPTPERLRALAVLEQVGLTPDDIHPGGITVSVTAVYWRKANQIHRWFVDNVQNGVDDCGRYYVSHAQIAELRDLCQRLLDSKLVGAGEMARPMAQEHLPPQEGFFFGSTEVDEWYWADLEETVSQLTTLLTNPKFDEGEWSLYYESSW